MTEIIISESERDAVYKTIHSRRDVRGEFKPDLIPDEVLKRVLEAAHHAPSVGYMQPWDFVVVKKTETKEKILAGFQTAQAEAVQMFDQSRRQKYQSLKLEGIMEAPLNICVTCDPTRNGPVVIGRTVREEMDSYSSVCAVQNLWLAARAENLGVGWVSIIHDDVLRDVLNIPSHVKPIAYLCVGYVSYFREEPELEELGWLPRENLNSLIHYENWTSS